MTSKWSTLIFKNFINSTSLFSVHLSQTPEGLIKCEIEHVRPDDCGAYKVVIENANGKSESLCAVAVTRRFFAIFMIEH